MQRRGRLGLSLGEAPGRWGIASLCRQAPHCRIGNLFNPRCLQPQLVEAASGGNSVAKLLCRLPPALEIAPLFSPHFARLDARKERQALTVLAAAFDYGFLLSVPGSYELAAFVRALSFSMQLHLPPCIGRRDQKREGTRNCPGLANCLVLQKAGRYLKLAPSVAGAYPLAHRRISRLPASQAPRIN